MKRKIKSFKDLIVWQKSANLEVLVYKITESFPRSELYWLVNQMRRIVVFIPSNIAEGFKRGQKKEKVQFYKMAYGLVLELKNQVEISKGLNYIHEEKYREILSLITEISKMLDSFIKSTNKNFSKSHILNFIFFLLFLHSIFYVLNPLSVQAASFTVTPVVIDEKAKARDILKESVILTNNTVRKLNIYTFVNNISTREGKQEFLDPSKADYASSLANWIAISRGVIELMPGEIREVDFLIEVNLRGLPGVYHALISFAEGSVRSEAKKKISNASSVMVNLEVIEDIKEYLQLKKFIPDKTFFSGFPILFSYELKNTGNRPLTPTGEIRIYNRRGGEVAVIEVNQEGTTLEPNTTLQLAGLWQGSTTSRTFANIGQGAKEFGRYKALLSLEYGAKQRGTLQDTVFFWITPWRQVLIIFGGLALIIILTTYFFHHRYERWHGKIRKTRGPKVIDLKHPHE